MPPNSPDEPVLGDPLFPGSSQKDWTPPRELRPQTSPPRRHKQRSAVQRQGAITQAIVTPGVRLALSVLAVFIGTVALGQAGAEPNPSVTTDSSPATNETSVAPTPKKTVLVSDPANTAIVREIAGDLLTVGSIIPPGANGHTYEPVPSDAVKAATADLYIENGMELNTAVTKFVRANYRQGTKEVNLSEVIPPAEVISSDSAEDIAAHGHSHAFNAHFWTDPIYAIAYAKRIAQSLEQLDPDNAPTYQARATAFIERLTVMDTRFKEAIASIPAQNRKLIVYHDSWSYFGRRYGIPVIGAIQPVSFSEPSANEIRRMIDQIRAQKVPAFFGSEVFPSDVLDAVAAETGARYYSDLSDEELPGEPGTPQHSYEGMMIENVRLITSALGGDVSILADLAPGAAL